MSADKGDFAEISLNTGGNPSSDGAADPASRDNAENEKMASGGAAAAPDNEMSAPPSASAPYEQYMRRQGDFYAATTGVLEKAIEDIKANTYVPSIDGANVLGAWLVFEVDHWDNETEKIVLLCDETLLTVRYDFIPMKIYKFKRTFLKDLDTIQMGDFKYPDKSLLNFSSDLKKRKCGGVRLLWNKGVEPGFLTSWRTSSDAMPWLTFTYHPLAFTEVGSSADSYNVEHFTQKAIDATNIAFSKHHPEHQLIIKEEPLPQQIYVGLPSQIHNQSFLGMSKERGGISF